MRACNHCCGGKATVIIYYECVFVAVVIQLALCMRNIAICIASRSIIFFHIISYNGTIKKKVY